MNYSKSFKKSQKIKKVAKKKNIKLSKNTTKRVNNKYKKRWC